MQFCTPLLTFAIDHLKPQGIPKDEIELTEEIVAKGDSGLEIKQKDPILADQTYFRKEDQGFDNLFVHNLSLFNPGEKEIAIVKVTTEYERDGKWILADTR